jgi:hypothetical protein
MNKKKLHIAMALIWAAVLIGASLLTKAEPGRMLDWELMWLIIGGYLVQSYLLNMYLKK